MEFKKTTDKNDENNGNNEDIGKKDDRLYKIMQIERNATSA